MKSNITTILNKLQCTTVLKKNSSILPPASRCGNLVPGFLGGWHKPPEPHRSAYSTKDKIE